MLPIILTNQKAKILCIGGGEAVAIKLKILTKVYDDITIIAQDYSKIQEYAVTKQIGNFWDISIDDMLKYDIIYLGIPYPIDKEIEYIDIINKLKQQKLVCVLGNHKLGNFIHPCTKEKDDILVSVSTKGKSPKLACTLAQKFVDSI